MTGRLRFDAGDALRRVGPLAMWLGLVALDVWLLAPAAPATGLLGFAEPGAVQVAAPDTAVVARVLVTPGDRVVAGQIIAELDDGAVVGGLAALEAERAVIAARAVADGADAGRRERAARHAVTRDVESAARLVAEVRGELAADRAELVARRGLARTRERLAEQGLIGVRDSDIDARIATLEGRIGRRSELLATLEATRAAALGRRDEAVGAGGALVVAADGIARAELARLDIRRDELERQRDALRLRAPASGLVEAVHIRAGEVARVAAAIATIAPSATDRVTVCIPERAAVTVRERASVVIRPVGADVAGVDVGGVVTALAPRVDALPERCQPDPGRTAWGRVGAVTADAALVPGLRYRIAVSGTRVDAPNASVAAGSPP